MLPALPCSVIFTFPRFRPPLLVIYPLNHSPRLSQAHAHEQQRMSLVSGQCWGWVVLRGVCQKHPLLQAAGPVAHVFNVNQQEIGLAGRV